MRYRNSDSFRTDAAHWGQTADLPAYVIEEIERLYERSDEYADAVAEYEQDAS